MALKLKSPLFLNVRDEVLRINPVDNKSSKNAVNHLILGDYARYLGETKDGWIRVRSRNSNGWLKRDWLTNKRLLEVNFVDIGQGDGCHIVTPDDKVILIDAGEGIGFSKKGGDNMSRFINWRYNLRNRKVKGVDGIKRTDPEANSPFHIDHVVISHPDLDHYYGFDSIFGNPKLRIDRIYHNGIVERSNKNVAKGLWLWDLGRKFPVGKVKDDEYLQDTVRSHKDMMEVLANPRNADKYYIKTLNKAVALNKKLKFVFLRMRDSHMSDFGPDNPLSIEVLAPITEDIAINGSKLECLCKIGNEGETKNGHSIVLKFKFGKLKMLLGGDLNRKSQDYIAQKYTGIGTPLSSLEKDIKSIRQKISNVNLSPDKREVLEQDLNENIKLQDLIIAKVNRVFGCDIAKACHHGASDVLDSFLKCINPIATVISSGDEESHSHPRPDALGAYGKASRGERPLIFSTELARSSTEFSYPVKFYNLLSKLAAHRDNQETKKDKERIQKRMNNLRDSNVAKYGMITVRSDGERVIIAQKLEKKRSNAQKWDIYDLHWNNKLSTFEYRT